MKKLSLVLGVLLALWPATTFALTFNQSIIVDDDAFTNSGAMSAARIQSFLDSQSSVLAGFSEGGRSAAQIIYDAAQTHTISPHVILSTLQKEQSLLTLKSYNTTTDPDGRLRKAMGYACPDSGGCDSKWAGFTKQIDGATGQFRYNFDGSTTKKFTDYQVGQTMTFDGTAVFIGNRATASLYRYTPHLSGNRSFFNVITTYFLQYASMAGAQNAYPTLAPGDSYKFSLKIQNTGDISWQRGTVFLGTDKAKDRVPTFLLENRTGNGEDTMWSSNNRISFQESSVPIGGVGTFNFYYTVPLQMSTGTYREYFRPLAENIQWMTDEGIYWDINVANHQAAWAGQNLGRKELEPGQSVQLEVILKNTGQTTWKRDGSTPVRLGTSKERDRMPIFIREDQMTNNPSGWVNQNRIQLVESSVAPGETGTFRFWYTVPTSVKPGTYREYFQPVHENVRWMEDLGIYFDLVVGPQKATWAGQSGNVTLKSGESAKFSVSFRNDGATTWKKEGDTPMRLGFVKPQDRSPGFIREDVPGGNPSGFVKPNRVGLVQDTVAPGETGTFTFWLTVPGDKKPGTYREQVAPVMDNYGWIAGPDVYWDITVQ